MLQGSVTLYLHTNQLRLPYLHLGFKGFDKRRPPHGLGLNNVVVQQHLHLVYAAQNTDARVAVGDEGVVDGRNAGL